MKNKTIFHYTALFFFTAAIASFFIVGCASPQSAFVPATATTPAQNIVTNYQPNIIGSQIASGAQQASALIPPPYGDIVGAGGALLALILGSIARQKNQQLVSVKDAADTLARTVVQSGAATVAVAHQNAVQDGTQSAVANHLANV